MSTIPLAKGFDPKKLVFPVYVSEKLDGVPVRIEVHPGHVPWPRSRQDKQVPSVGKQSLALAQRLWDYGAKYNHTFVAEVTHQTFTDFKDVSGVVRRQEQSNDLILNIFDYDTGHDLTFAERQTQLRMLHNTITSRTIKIVPQWIVESADRLEQAIANAQMQHPNAEGFVARSHNATFKPGARHWDYQKIVADPTVDLLIVGVEEGKGKNAGAAGKLIALYKGSAIGVGPGKLSYAERATLLDYWQSATPEPRLAKIKYKLDDSYTALRQPTFQCWRDDKDEVSYD